MKIRARGSVPSLERDMGWILDRHWGYEWFPIHPTYREVIQKRFVEKQSFPKIGKDLDVGTENARYLYKAALLELKSMWLNLWNDADYAVRLIRDTTDKEDFEFEIEVTAPFLEEDPTDWNRHIRTNSVFIEMRRKGLMVVKELSVRDRQILAANGIHTLADLQKCKWADLLALKDLKPDTVENIREAMVKFINRQHFEGNRYAGYWVRTQENDLPKKYGDKVVPPFTLSEN